MLALVFMTETSFFTSVRIDVIWTQLSRYCTKTMLIIYSATLWWLARCRSSMFRKTTDWVDLIEEKIVLSLGVLSWPGANLFLNMSLTKSGTKFFEMGVAAGIESDECKRDIYIRQKASAWGCFVRVRVLISHLNPQYMEQCRSAFF